MLWRLAGLPFGCGIAAIIVVWNSFGVCTLVIVLGVPRRAGGVTIGCVAPAFAIWIDVVLVAAPYARSVYTARSMASVVGLAGVPSTGLLDIYLHFNHTGLYCSAF